MEIIPLTKELASVKAEEILVLEHNWKAIGDDPWKVENLMYELPLKWKLSHLAIHEGKIVGYQIGSLRDGSAFLNKIIVDKSIRKLGMGKKLLFAFLEKCLQENIERIKFRVRVDNPAVVFYDKLGFQKSDETDNTRQDGVPSYFYDNRIQEVLNHVENHPTL